MDIKDNNKKYVKLKALDKAVVIMTGMALSATIFATGVIAAFGIKNYKVSQKANIGNEKFQSYVEDELSADMDIMYQMINSDIIVKLASNKDKQIPVYIDQTVPERTKGNIRIVLTEINNIFSNINDKYHLVETDQKEYLKRVKKQETVVSFRQAELEDSLNGECSSDLSTVKSGVITYKSEIVLNDIYFDNLTDEEQLSVIMHELLHTFGLGDIYEGYFDETSMMNTSLTGITWHISPNDFKMLYVIYGNKHINKNGSLNQKKLEEVKCLIDRYEEAYYRYLIGKIKDAGTETLEKISLQDLSTYCYHNGDDLINIDANGNYTFVVGGYKKSGKLVMGEDYAVIPDVKINKNNDYLVLFKINGKIKCYNVGIQWCYFEAEDEVKPLYIMDDVNERN